MFLSHYLNPIGDKSILCCDFNVTKILIILPKYKKECFECFEKCSGARQRGGNLSLEDISKTVICIHGKSVYNQKLINKGIIRIIDLISEGNRFITPGEFSPLEFFFFFNYGYNR